ncbi:putative cysteine alpha-hairpin motif superfamily [Medicago truncatula]|uniref:Putative cysteine alpha-hairpin motif superfamily n=1 Tax=Medicago truncatula TaxID=3880 RepID=A0A396GSS3_MEDTR|nr:putative cysteine alpha-hairpin motif superfamily [Medicago truncatula]
MDEGGAKPVCGQEALDLLNCVTDSPSYDKDKCLALLNSLRECVLSKKVKKFSLAGQEQQETNPSSKKA